MRKLLVSKMPLKLELSRVPNVEWVRNLRWLSRAHHQVLVGRGGIEGDVEATFRNKLVFRLVPDAIPVSQRRELFSLLMAVARHKATSTRRTKNVGGGVRPLTRAGTPSVYLRPQPLRCLRHAREGVFGFQGVGRGCEACAFNRDFPVEYSALAQQVLNIGDIYKQQLPIYWERNHRRLEKHSHLAIGGKRGAWTQGVANLGFPMTAHPDDKNANGALSVFTVFGDFSGGYLILPEFSVAISLSPGDLLFFDGHHLHGVSPFTGVRLSLVLYLHKTVLHCPCSS
jgi:hypothetical protein